MPIFSSAADTVSGAYQIGYRVASVVVRRPDSASSTIHFNRYSSYNSQPILTKLGTKLEPQKGQKLLGTEFWIFAFVREKADDFVIFQQFIQVDTPAFLKQS